MGAFLACVLACRPGFSPDGRRVVFSIIDDDAKTTYLRVYDRKTEKISTVRTLPWSAESNRVFCAASWSPSGAQIGLVLVREAAPGTVEILDAETGREIRSVPLTNTAEGLVMTPPVFNKDFLFFGGKRLSRLNLRNGRLDVENVGTNSDREIYILNAQNGLHYYGEPQNDGTTSSNVELGIIDPELLTRIPEQTIAAELGGIPDVSPDGKRIVLWQKNPHSQIQVWSQSKLEKSIPLTQTNSLVVGNLIWSKDQKVLFAPIFQDIEQGGADAKSSISVWEIPLNGSPIQKLELGSSKSKIEEASTSCQLAMAPNGKALALGTPFGSLDRNSQRTALYLIDLGAPKRTVKSVAFRTQTR